VALPLDLVGVLKNNRWVSPWKLTHTHMSSVCSLSTCEVHRIIFALFFNGRVYLVGLFKINQFWALLLFVKFVMQPRSIKGKSQKWLLTTGWRTKWHSSITTYPDILLYFDYVLKKWW